MFFNNCYLDVNFVLYKDAFSEKNFVWQGFDHLADTYLPEMKLGWNKKTGKKNKFMTSWKRNISEIFPNFDTMTRVTFLQLRELHFFCVSCD